MAPEMGQPNLDDILITDALSHRPSKVPNLKAENEAFRALARHLIEQPQTMLKTLVILAKELCQAGTAGVSLLETTPSGEEIFRWVAIAGELKHYGSGITPRHLSPCGVSIERQSPQLYSDPARYFTELQQVEPPIVEELIIPLIAADRPLGAIWIFSHDPQQQFDSEDVRVMSSLADFMAAALYNNQTRQAAEQMGVALRQREAELSLVTNAVPVLISFVDTEQRYRFANQAYEEWFGCQVYGKTLWEVLGEAAYQTIRPYVEQALAGQQVTFENEIHYQNAGTRYVSVTYIPRTNSEGTIEGFASLVSDISERKQTEAALRQSEERLRFAQQAAKAGVWNWDIVTNQVTWSAEYYHLYGLDPDTTQPSYQNWLASIVAQDRDRVDAVAHECLEHQTNLNVEFRILHPTQGERWLTAIGQTFCDANQQPIRMTGIALDITERKQVEAALRQSESRFQTLVKNVPGMIYRYVPGDGEDVGTGSFAYVSSGSRELFGLEPETVLQDRSALWSLIHPDDLPSLQTSVAAAVANSTNWQWQGRIFTTLGQLKWIQSKSRVEETENGKVWDGLLVDISEQQAALHERKRAEAQVRQQTLQSQILAEVSQAFSEALLDYEAVLDTITQRCADLLGDGCAIRLLSDDGQWLNPVAIYHRDPDMRTFIHEYLIKTIQKAGEGLHASVLRTNQPLLIPTVCMDDLRAKLPPAALPFLEHFQVSTILIAPLRARGRVMGTIGMYRDQLGQPYTLADQVFLQNLADRAALGIDNARLYREAQQANRIKDEFLAVLSHELRSPLNPILGWAKLLQGRKLDEAKTATALASIERNAKLQAELIEDLLDVSRILQGKLNLNMVPVNLVSTIQAAMETVRLAAEAKSIQIHTELDASAGKILGDSARIQQVIWNLLSNAVKFTPTGGQVEVRLEQVEWRQEGEREERGEEEMNGNGDDHPSTLSTLSTPSTHPSIHPTVLQKQATPYYSYAQITVSDTGKGISPDFLPYVFDYFRQADSATTRKFGGLGLGLAIVRQLVELHGGKVQADSPGEGQGTTFTVKLPLLKGGRESISSETASLYPSFLLPHSLQGMRVLLVDDEADAQDLITFILEEAGAIPTVASSAIEALAIFPQLKPDVIISDIGMPEMDGYMLIQQIRTMPPEQGGQVPAIALTAYAGEINQRQAMAAGFQHHLTKPVEPNELIRVIRSIDQKFQPNSQIIE